MSNRVREVRGRASNTQEYALCENPCVEKSITGDGHRVAASCISSDHLSCTIFFSPSQDICREEQTRTALSRRLTKLLRHDAARRGLPIGSDGYVCVSKILALPEFRHFSISDLLCIVNCDAKRRYSVRVDDSVALNMRRGNSNRKPDVLDDCRTLRADNVNPLFEQDSRAAAGDHPPVEERFLKNIVARDDRPHVQVAQNNSPAVIPPSAIVYVEYGNECLCAAHSIPCLPHSTGTNSTLLPVRFCKSESANCCVYRTAAGCGKEAPADRALDARNLTSKENPSGSRLCSHPSSFSGYVDASQVCIRAVQGHSMSFVDSDKLLRRVSTLADLVGSVTVPITQKRGPTVSSSAKCESLTCSTYRVAAESLPAVAQPAEAAASASGAGISLVHGTYWRHWKSIQKIGLCRMSRNHIHFATRLPEEGEVISGIRSSAEIFIYLDVERVLASGLRLYVSENGVVLSPGNEKGVIECKFFKKVVDRKTGKHLVINGTEYDAAEGAGQH